MPQDVTLVARSYGKHKTLLGDEMAPSNAEIILYLSRRTYDKGNQLFLPLCSQMSICPLLNTALTQLAPSLLALWTQSYHLPSSFVVEC